MNLYFVVEGKRTEKKVYPAWLKHAFPTLRRVERVEDLAHDHYFIISGEGYPQYLKTIDDAVEDTKRYHALDRLFVCIDSEEDGADVKLAEVQARVDARRPAVPCHVIVHNCCMETWFLGNPRIMTYNPQSQELRDCRAFYDVSADDPEHMPCAPGHQTRAQFHVHYLRAMFREKGRSYTKQNPGDVMQRYYLDALVDRHSKTQHIRSFGRLVEVWRAMGGQI